jgi:predicted alpha/beta superfamily hydrolase
VTQLSWQEFSLPGAQVCKLRSVANGVQYRISLWVPPGTAPAGGWPSIYVLDANALFCTFVEAVRRSSRRPDATGIVPMAVVGIVADDDDLYAPALRERDFTPDKSDAAGAEAFLRFVLDELAPSLQSAFPLDGKRRALFGHSLAGFFALYALLARPGAFQCSAAISPSIWADEASLSQRLTRVAGADVRVFIAVGEWEEQLPPWQRRLAGREDVIEKRTQRRMVANARAFSKQLGALLGEERVHFRVFPEEDHASVLMVACQRALRFCSGF